MRWIAGKSVLYFPPSAKTQISLRNCAILSQPLPPARNLYILEGFCLTGQAHWRMHIITDRRTLKTGFPALCFIYNCSNKALYFHKGDKFCEIWFFRNNWLLVLLSRLVTKSSDISSPVCTYRHNMSLTTSFYHPLVNNHDLFSIRRPED